MKRLTVDELRETIPDLDELRPVLDLAISESQPVPGREWSGSGELGTAGSQLVDVDALQAAVIDLARQEHEHLSVMYGLIADTVAYLQSEEPATAAETLLAAAAREEARGRFGRARAYADAAYRAARGTGRADIVAQALRRRGRAEKACGQFVKALRDYEASFEMARAAGDTRGTAESAVGAGNVLEDQGHWTVAEAWYRKALDSLGEKELVTAESWHALLNLHVVLRSRGALDESLEPLEEAIEVARRIDDASAEPFCKNALGQWHMAGGRFAEAVDHLRSGVAASTNVQATVTIRLNLAEALFADGRRLEAFEETRRAEREALAARLPRRLAEIYRLLGRLAAADQNPDAFVLFERALEVIESQGLPRLERAITLQAYATAEADAGNSETSAALFAQGDAIYQELEIDHRRDTWADAYPSDADRLERGSK